jgi:ribosomal-protein-alanine N-acetyltransferase
MTRDDLDGVVAIERGSFSEPWTREMFRWELTENPRARFFVAVAGDAFVGYIGGWTVADELQVVSLAVRPEARRRRVASRLLSHLFEQAGESVQRAYLEVRRSNRGAIDMYERFGFRVVGVRRGYYDQPKEDALLMERITMPPASGDASPRPGALIRRERDA